VEPGGRFAEKGIFHNGEKLSPTLHLDRFCVKPGQTENCPGGPWERDEFLKVVWGKIFCQVWFMASLCTVSINDQILNARLHYPQVIQKV